MRIKRKLKQKLVHWPGAANDGYGGYTYGTAVEYICRWQDKQETFKDFDGEEQISNAIIYMEVGIARKGSWVYKGELADLDSEHSDPKSIDNAFPIQAIQESPNVRGTQTLYKVYV